MKPLCRSLKQLLLAGVLVPFIASAQTPTPSPPPPVCTLNEGFASITTLGPSGWAMLNKSSPLGTNSWFQGNTAVFNSHTGTPNSYIGVNFNSGASVATISNWLLTPPITLQNGAKLSFWTRTLAPVSIPDRLQVRLSTNGAFANVGSSATDIGDFTTLLLDINPTYTTTGYPTLWTNYVVTISGLGGPTTGRLALRYFVANGGPNGPNSNYIGIDALTYDCNGGPTPTPTPAPTPSPMPDPFATSLQEGFDNTKTLGQSGWIVLNKSSPLGTTGWFQGNTAIFPSYSGPANSYVAADFHNGAGVATISNWLLTPPVILGNGVSLSFWTRTLSPVSSPDRLQVRMSTNGASTNVGTSATDVGDFTTLLLDINPSYSTTGYPVVWTRYFAPLPNPGYVNGRLAFRYFIENGGTSGVNSEFIGIDKVTYCAIADCFLGAISVTGSVSYCSNPSRVPVSHVTMTLAGPGTSGRTTLTDGSGNYALSTPTAWAPSFTVTPSKAALPPATPGINTVDMVLTQKHFLNQGPPLSGCRLTAADVNGDAAINTADVIAIQRFFIGQTSGIANTGSYKFSPVNRSYPQGGEADFTGQNYDALILGDVATPFADRAAPPDAELTLAR